MSSLCRQEIVGNDVYVSLKLKTIGKFQKVIYNPSEMEKLINAVL